MPSNVSILTQINQSSGITIVPIYTPTDADTSGYITTLKATVNIKSIGQANFPYIPDNTPAETLEAILTQLGESLAYFEAKLVVKKGANGPWLDNKTMRLFNKDPYYEMDLLAYLTDSNTFDCGPDFTIGLQMLSPLGTGDYITVLGCAVEEKKTDDLELLTSRVNALETLLSTFTGATASAEGAVGLVPKPVAGDQSKYLRGDRTWQTVSGGGGGDLDADLVAIAALTGTGLYERTGDGTAAIVPVSAFMKAVFDDADAAAARSSFGLGTAATASAASFQPAGSYQTADPDLTAIAALTGTGLVERTGDGTAAITPVTTFAKTLLDDTTAAIARATLGTPGLADNNSFSGTQTNTNTTDSTSVTTGAEVISGGLAVGKFTTLGDNVAIKVKRITGTTAASEGGSTLINHALDGTKIIGTFGIVNHVAGSGLPPGYTYLAGYQYSITHTSTQIALFLQTGNSANILNKPFTIVIVYTN